MLPELWDLVDLTDEELARRDIAVVNLACAAKLPDAGNLDVRACTSRLDYLAAKARKFIEKSLPQFQRNPAAYQNSEEYFRILCLITCLQRDNGIRYNPAKTDPNSTLDTVDSFIHGPLLGEGGTCGSLPVLYAAVGRRLCYPIKLVETMKGDVGHLFCRWDDPLGERFNIDASGRGLKSEPDDYYRTGDYALTPEREKASGYLRSMTPKQELASFLCQRAYRWREFGTHWRMAESAIWACGLDPENKLSWNSLVTTLYAWRDKLEARKPPGFPPIAFENHRRYSPSIPPEAITNLLWLQATELMLDDPMHDGDWWEPMRKGLTLKTIPVRCRASFRRDGTDLQIDFRWPTEFKWPNLPEW